MSLWLGSSKPKKMADELDAIREEIASIARRVSSIAGSTGDSLMDNVSQLRAALPDSGAVSRATASALDQGRHYLDQAGAEMRGGVRHAQTAVRENPLVSIAIAASAGFLVGLIAGSCRSGE